MLINVLIVIFIILGITANIFAYKSIILGILFGSKDNIQLQNDYNDEKQSKHFCESLTPEVISRLKEIEGIYT